MSRMARAVLVGVAHHLTQRWSDRKQVFMHEADYEVYLDLVRSNAKIYETELLGYCLIPSHVHCVVAPKQKESLSRTFGESHECYAAYANTKLSRCGHFWQNRFYSCPMDQAHLWVAMRYVGTKFSAGSNGRPGKRVPMVQRRGAIGGYLASELVRCRADAVHLHTGREGSELEIGEHWRSGYKVAKKYIHGETDGLAGICGLG